MSNPSTTSKDVGLIKAIHVGNTPPDNLSMIWGDNSGLPNTSIVHKYFDVISEEWKPIGVSDPNSGNSYNMPNLGSVIFVSGSGGSDTTGAVGQINKPFKTIQKAVLTAQDLASDSNRISIVVFPYYYDENVFISNNNISLSSHNNNNKLYKYENFVIEFGTMKRDVVLKSLNISSNNIGIYGIDILNTVITSDNSNQTSKNIKFDNSVINSIEGAGSSPIGSLIFHDCLISNMFNNTNLPMLNIYCNEVKSNIAWNNGSSGNIQSDNFYINNCTFGANSFSNRIILNNANISESKFLNNTLQRIQNSKLFNIVVGDNSLANISDTELIQVVGGNNCLKDFTNIVVKTSKFSSFGSGNQPQITGNFEDVTSNYDEGFCYGRPWYGKMRNMFIRANTSSASAVNVHLPQGSIPANIEYSTILNCNIQGKTITGERMFLSFCKLNKIYENQNLLGNPNNSYNIVDNILCNQTGAYCTPPSTFTSIQSNISNGTATFEFNATLPSNRAGTQLEITMPNGNLQYEIVEIGNSGGATNINFSITLNSASEGNYSFRIKTICSFDPSGNNITSSSQSFGPINVSLTEQIVRVKAWRGMNSQCELDYAQYSVIDFDVNNGNHRINRNFDDGLTQFQYTIFCSSTGSTIGLYTVQFNQGQLTSAPITGLQASCFTSMNMITSSFVGNRVMKNTGIQKFTNLEQYFVDNGDPTGVVKPNDSNDPDYIAPAQNLTVCPLPTTVPNNRFINIQLFEDTLPTDYYYSGNLKVLRQSDLSVIEDITIPPTSGIQNISIQPLSTQYNYVFEYNLSLDFIPSTGSPENKSMIVNEYLNQFIGNPGSVQTNGSGSIVMTNWTNNTQYITLEIKAQEEVENFAWRGIDPFCEAIENEATYDVIPNTSKGHQLQRSYDDGIYAFQYNIIYNGNTIGPFNAQFTPGQSLSTPIYNMPQTIGSGSVVSIISGTKQGTLVPHNTGMLSYSLLEEYNVDTGIATGTVKPNDSGDPDYIAPTTDLSQCPTPTPIDQSRYVKVIADLRPEHEPNDVIYGTITFKDQMGNDIGSVIRDINDASADPMLFDSGDLPMEDFSVECELYCIKSGSGEPGEQDSEYYLNNANNPITFINPQTVLFNEWGHGTSQFLQIFVGISQIIQ